ncbi:MAG: helix-turn-helix domain-containing protein [Candidatus Uhrbacteria bacterium]
MAFVSKRLNAVGRLGPDMIELRERAGITIEEAAQKTKIAPSIIRALETETWSELPDQVYAERLLRSYVSYFGYNESYYLHKFREAREAASVTRDTSVLLPRATKLGIFELTVTPRILAAAGFIIFTCVLGAYVYTQARAMSVAPPLSIESPVDGAHVQDPAIVVRGFTAAGSSVTVNGAPAVVGDDGSFEERMNIPRGATVIRIVSRRRHGSESTAAIRVVYDRAMPTTDAIEKALETNTTSTR